MTTRIGQYWLSVSALLISSLLTTSVSAAANPPCDKYPTAKQL
jgi:hypothetical protein